MGLILLGYLDAGSGSMLVQVLLGGLAAAGVAIKLWWRRIVAFFRRERREEPAPPTAE